VILISVAPAVARYLGERYRSPQGDGMLTLYPMRLVPLPGVPACLLSSTLVNNCLAFHGNAMLYSFDRIL
jgi:hypothetical protein